MAQGPSGDLCMSATEGPVLATAAAERQKLGLVFAGLMLALVLAMVGVYGVVGWSSAQRTREFGLRSALGATPGAISSLVLREGLAPVGAGALVGIGTTLALAGTIRALLFDTAPTDPVTYLGAGVLVGAAAAVACWIPARRAARIDPVRALRTEV